MLQMYRMKNDENLLSVFIAGKLIQIVEYFKCKYELYNSVIKNSIVLQFHLVTYCITAYHQNIINLSLKDMKIC